MASSALPGSRQPSTTAAPAVANCSATKYPMPALAPVTKTVLPLADAKRSDFMSPTVAPEACIALAQRRRPATGVA